MFDRSIDSVMQREVVTLAPSDRLDAVEDLMRLGRIRHLPVLEDGRLVGIVSQRDLLAAALSKSLDFEPGERRSFLHSVLVSEVMTHEPVTIHPEASLRDALSRLLERKIGCLPVVSRDGRFRGLLTDTDLLRAALGESAGEEVDRQREGAMTRLNERFEEEIQSLRRTRDELRVKMHLARADARDLWEDMESSFHELESKFQRVGREAEAPMHEIGEAAKLLVEELREGYRKIRDAI